MGRLAILDWKRDWESAVRRDLDHGQSIIKSAVDMWLQSMFYSND